mgnify:CR=1 FL=1
MSGKKSKNTELRQIMRSLRGSFAVVWVFSFVANMLMLMPAIYMLQVYDRVLAVNLFGTKTALLLSVMAFLVGRPDFLDLALAYALINLVGVLAVLEFTQTKPAKAKVAEHD